MLGLKTMGFVIVLHKKIHFFQIVEKKIWWGEKHNNRVCKIIRTYEMPVSEF